MKKMKTKLIALAGVVAFLTLAASASATLREAALISAYNASPGDSIATCDYQPIYAYGANYVWSTGQVACAAWAYDNSTWYYNNSGDCSAGDFQRVSLRTNTTTYATGKKTVTEDYWSTTRAYISSRINGGTCMTGREIRAYSYGIDM